MIWVLTPVSTLDKWYTFVTLTQRVHLVHDSTHRLLEVIQERRIGRQEEKTEQRRELSEVYLK